MKIKEYISRLLIEDETEYLLVHIVHHPYRSIRGADKINVDFHRGREKTGIGLYLVYQEIQAPGSISAVITDDVFVLINGMVGLFHPGVKEPVKVLPG